MLFTLAEEQQNILVRNEGPADITSILSLLVSGITSYFTSSLTLSAFLSCIVSMGLSTFKISTTCPTDKVSAVKLTYEGTYVSSILRISLISG